MVNNIDFQAFKQKIVFETHIYFHNQGTTLEIGSKLVVHWTKGMDTGMAYVM